MWNESESSLSCMAFGSSHKLAGTWAMRFLLALFWPLLESSGVLIVPDGDQCGLIFQGNLSKTALGVISSVLRHGRGPRFRPSYFYQ
jgi:hypothetical protein